VKEDLNHDIFMLVDGSAIVHRAYHAIPNFTRGDGVPTGAVHGFFQMVFKMIENLRPAHIAIAFDRPKPTFRQLMYAGYQAQRPKMESELSGQFKIIIEILEKANICTYAVDGYEADDIIGTLAYEAVRGNRKSDGSIAYIVTGDRDMLQLVNDRVKVMAPVKGISEVTIFDADKVREKYGINPSQFVDLKGLMGDSSDNYPGVAGVGPKTAAILINSYGSIEDIYKNLGEIALKKKGLAEKLVSGAEAAALAKTLAKILTDVPFSHDFSDMDFKKIDVGGLRSALEKYEFKTLPKRVDEVFNKGIGDSVKGKVDSEKKKKMEQMKLI